MHGFVGINLALAITAAATGSRAAPPPPLAPLTFLLGEWDSAGSGKPGEASGKATFALSLQDRVLVRTSYAEYPASATAPASRHDDLMIIYATGGAGVRADCCDSEGHVIHYTVTVARPGETSFVSDVLSGAPRYRLTYTLGSDGVLKGEFEIAPPGKPEAFGRYLAWESRQAKPSGK